MKAPKKLALKLLCTAGYGVILGIFYLLKIPCLLRWLTGIPCPGCGMTRAWLCALRLDLAGALGYHPMFWSIPILLLFIFYDGRLFRRPFWNRCSLILLAIGFAASYLARLFGFLSGNPLF